MSSSKAFWQKVAKHALLSRELDQLEIDKLVPQGKVKYQFSAMGHELAQVLLAQALTHPHDAAAIYYRSRPFIIASGFPIEEVIGASLARAVGPTQGRDVGVIFNMPRNHGLTIFPAPGNVGAQYTPIAGWAQSILYHQRVLEEHEWKGAIAVAIGGDGSIASNGFWAALNIVTTLKLPYLFFIEDNNYGISVPSSLQTPNGNIAANLESFGNLKALEGDGTNPINAWEIINEAIEYARSGEGPCLLRMKVVRLLGHTLIDDQSYKTYEERNSEIERDPITRLRDYMIQEALITSEGWEDLVKVVRNELLAATQIAENFPEPDPQQATRHLFYEGVPPIQGGLRPENALLPLGENTPKPSGPRINMVDAIRRTLEVEMSINPRILVFGEDVGVKGGVHGATIGMQRRFGPDRVFDTSLSEEGIIGRSIGLALSGLLPVPEIQFRKYADPAFEQIVELGTLRWRTVNRFAAPVIIRMPVGFSKKTADPYHSVSGEAIYIHTPGWRIAYPSNAEDAVGLLRTALRGDDPTLFLEHRALLDAAEGRRTYPGDDYCIPFGVASTVVSGDTLMIITWGAMLYRCLEAAKPHNGKVMILDLRTLVPWDRETVFEGVRKTGKVLIVHEDTLTGGFAAEISATIITECFSDLDAPIQRLAPPDTPIPYNSQLANRVLPSMETIRKNIEDLINY